MQQMGIHDAIFQLAVANDCQPFWHNGIYGWAWHCGCIDNTHCCDQQCSTISLRSARNNRRETEAV